jgi:Fur family zinc uptake transcriptional regulator
MVTIEGAVRRLPLEAYRLHGSEAGLRWTGTREAVLRLIWGSGKPLGAYEAAARLSSPERPVHAASVYRCLNCLSEAGLILPLLAWKKYLISPDPGVRTWGVLLCGGCGACSAVDLSGQADALHRRCAEYRFVPRAFAAECEGRCGGCTDRGGQP